MAELFSGFIDVRLWRAIKALVEKKITPPKPDSDPERPAEPPRFSFDHLGDTDMRHFRACLENRCEIHLH